MSDYDLSQHETEVRYGYYGGLMGGAVIGSAQQQMNNYGAAQMPASIAALLARPQATPGKKVTMFGSVKKYFDDHRDLLMTMIVLILVDQFVFDGAFKEKIKLLIDRVIGHADAKIKQLEAKK